MSGSTSRYSILRKQGYRVLVVERHLVFYKLNEDEKVVTIYAIVDGRREYRSLI
ncbi:MAG: type II toxin-antitoxin system RelE/ParE family toxin [Lachnospiraceae bacterium]|nr:type II toxin-antitoxin system RelE/ParE family toxin [Lachnospiraceae bacterium]